MIEKESILARLAGSRKVTAWLPGALAVFGLLGLGWWLTLRPKTPISMRVPGTDQPPGANGAAITNAVLLGHLQKSDGTPASLPGSWTGFRGAQRDGRGYGTARLARTLDAPGPRALWDIELGEGYAGAAVSEGRVYVMDYDREKKQDALRCLSLADGKEIWRFTYPVSVKRNHGMTRTVPALAQGKVVAIGPKCHVVCLNATTGELSWGFDMVKQFGATIPPWYTGQCPLIEGDKVILAPGGQQALLVAVELATGKLVWKTPNPSGWKMTHSSIMPMDVTGQHLYVYCASSGVVGVSANDGSLLWQNPDWKISIATVPSPLVLSDGRLFLSGGYDAGSLFLTVARESGVWMAKTGLRLGPETFGATQQTPVCFENHIYGVRPDGQFVCLDLNGKVLWSSGASHQFGLGSFLLADGVFFAIDDAGRLSLIEATPEKFNQLAHATVLKGRESWAPMALAEDHLIVRDLTHMVCLDVGRH